MVDVKTIAISVNGLAINEFSDVEELNGCTSDLQGNGFKLVGVWRSKDGKNATEVYLDPNFKTRKEVA